MSEEVEELEEEIEYKYVIGQDPGETTGVAVLRYTENTKPELVYLHQIPNGREGFFYFFIGTEMGYGTNNTSVSEKWEQREGVHSANLEPVRIEGVQDAIWVFQTVYQSPVVKNMVGDEFLKVMNLWTPGKRHQMDALLHAIYYLRDIGHEPTLKSLSGDDQEPWEPEGGAEQKTLPNGAPGEGEPGDSGEGSPGNTGDGFAEAMQKMTEAIREASKSMQQTGEDASEEAGEGSGAVGGEAQDGEGNGPGHNGLVPGGYYEDDGTIGEAKPKRSLNGAFIGFEED